MDLSRSSKEGKIVFIDGLTSLFGASEDISNIGYDDGKAILRDARIQSIDKEVRHHIGTSSEAERENVILMIDGLDLLLAATELDAMTLSDILADWRDVSCPQLIVQECCC